MKKGIGIVFMAFLAISFFATATPACSLHSHGYRGTHTKISGYGVDGYVQVHSTFIGPPMFFPLPPPPPFLFGTVDEGRDCRCRHHGSFHHNKCRRKHHGAYHHKHHRHRDKRRHGHNHRCDGNDKGKHRSKGHRNRI